MSSLSSSSCDLKKSLDELEKEAEIFNPMSFQEFCEKHGKDIYDETIEIMETTGVDLDQDACMIEAMYWYSYLGPEGETKEVITNIFETWYCQRILGFKGKIINKTQLDTLELPEKLKNDLNNNGYCVIGENETNESLKKRTEDMLNSNN